MAIRKHIVNPVGSAVMTLPTNLSVDDELLFNVTNTNTTTKYNGTILAYTFPFDCKAWLFARGARGGKGNGCTDADVGKGARVDGLFSFKKGDTLVICVGQAGTDHGGTSGDGTSGAGGGGTFVAIKTEDGTGDDFFGEVVGGTGGTRWKVKPLIVSAGGNGGRDKAYSGSGTVYHGLYTMGGSHESSNYCGGSYNNYYNYTHSGQSFIAGGKGATANYTRNGTSYAGFGGGGGNKDDGEGGGGGGYWNGTVTRSATSYISPTALKTGGSTGENFGEGCLFIRFTEIAGSEITTKINGEFRRGQISHVKIDGAWKKANKAFVKVNGKWCDLAPAVIPSEIPIYEYGDDIVLKSGVSQGFTQNSYVEVLSMDTPFKGYILGTVSVKVWNGSGGVYIKVESLNSDNRVVYENEDFITQDQMANTSVGVASRQSIPVTYGGKAKIYVKGVASQGVEGVRYLEPQFRGNLKK